MSRSSSLAASCGSQGWLFLVTATAVGRPTKCITIPGPHMMTASRSAEHGMIPSVCIGLAAASIGSVRQSVTVINQAAMQRGSCKTKSGQPATHLQGKYWNRQAFAFEQDDATIAPGN